MGCTNSSDDDSSSENENSKTGVNNNNGKKGSKKDSNKGKNNESSSAGNSGEGADGGLTWSKSVGSLSTPAVLKKGRRGVPTANHGKRVAFNAEGVCIPIDDSLPVAVGSEQSGVFSPITLASPSKSNPFLPPGNSTDDDIFVKCSEDEQPDLAAVGPTSSPSGTVGSPSGTQSSRFSAAPRVGSGPSQMRAHSIAIKLPSTEGADSPASGGIKRVGTGLGAAMFGGSGSGTGGSKPPPRNLNPAMGGSGAGSGGGHPNPVASPTLPPKNRRNMPAAHAANPDENSGSGTASGSGSGKAPPNGGRNAKSQPSKMNAANPHSNNKLGGGPSRGGTSSAKPSHNVIEPQSPTSAKREDRGASSIVTPM